MKGPRRGAPQSLRNHANRTEDQEGGDALEQAVGAIEECLKGGEIGADLHADALHLLLRIRHEHRGTEGH